MFAGSCGLVIFATFVIGVAMTTGATVPFFVTWKLIFCAVNVQCFLVCTILPLPLHTVLAVLYEAVLIRCLLLDQLKGIYSYISKLMLE